MLGQVSEVQSRSDDGVTLAEGVAVATGIGVKSFVNVESEVAVERFGAAIADAVRPNENAPSHAQQAIHNIQVEHKSCRVWEDEPLEIFERDRVFNVDSFSAAREQRADLNRMQTIHDLKRYTRNQGPHGL